MDELVQNFDKFNATMCLISLNVSVPFIKHARSFVYKSWYRVPLRGSPVVQSQPKNTRSATENTMSRHISILFCCWFKYGQQNYGFWIVGTEFPIDFSKTSRAWQDGSIIHAAGRLQHWKTWTFLEAFKALICSLWPQFCFVGQPPINLRVKHRTSERLCWW